MVIAEARMVGSHLEYFDELLLHVGGYLSTMVDLLNQRGYLEYLGIFVSYM